MEHTIDTVAEPISEPIGIVEKEKVITWIVRLTQFLTWPILYVLFRLVFEVKIQGRNNLSKLNNPFIVIANHISFYDSFIFRLALGFFTPHLPLRFMAVKKFNYKMLNFLTSIGVISFVYTLFGVFTIVKGNGIAKNLKVAKTIINNGGNVVIYPEGSIRHEEGVGEFRPGAAILAQTTHARVLPISMRIKESGRLRDILAVNIGEPIAVISKNTDENTKMFREILSKLYYAK